MYRGVKDSRTLQSKMLGLLEDEFYRILSVHKTQGVQKNRVDDWKQVYSCLDHLKQVYNIDEDIKVLMGSLESMMGVFLFKNEQSRVM